MTDIPEHWFDDRPGPFASSLSSGSASMRTAVSRARSVRNVNVYTSVGATGPPTTVEPSLSVVNVAPPFERSFVNSSGFHSVFAAPGLFSQAA